MNFYINVDECEKSGISIDIFLYILSLYLKKGIDPYTFDTCCVKGLVEYSRRDVKGIPMDINLTAKGLELVESIILNSEFAVDNSNARFDNLAEKLIELYPKGEKPGTKQMWRDSKPIIAKRLKALIKKYEVSFTDEEAIEATKRYINSFDGDTRFMQILKYFLLKKDKTTGLEDSQFLSYLENKDEDLDHTLDSNWKDELV